MMKCKEEQENHGYLEIYETTSTFIQQVFDMITDKLTKVYSFVETMKDTTKKEETSLQY